MKVPEAPKSQSSLRLYRVEDIGFRVQDSMCDKSLLVRTQTSSLGLWGVQGQDAAT